MARPPRVDAPGSWFFVTTVTHGRRAFLARPSAARAVLEALGELRTEERVLVAAYVLMPDHVHAILLPTRANLSDLMRRWKSLSWHRCREAAGLRTRLWQEGFFDRGIRSPRQLAAQIDYIHLNPIRAGLVDGAEQWPWSSIHAYLGRPAPLEVDQVDGD